MSTAVKVKDRLADYIPVNERLEQFYAEHPSGRVLTSVLEHSAEHGFILMRAEIYRNQDDAAPAATGHAFENRSEGYVNRTSYIENCETSAVGRGLALLGYEIKRGIASREEMEKVERMSGPKEVKPTERDTLLAGVQDACKLLNSAGDVPPWTPARLKEYVLSELGAANMDDLGVVEIRELLKRLSLRLDIMKDAERIRDNNFAGDPLCECGIPRVRREGNTKGKPWAAWMCSNKVKEHSPIWIDLNAEAEAKAIEEEPPF